MAPIKKDRRLQRPLHPRLLLAPPNALVCIKNEVGPSAQTVVKNNLFGTPRAVPIRGHGLQPSSREIETQLFCSTLVELVVFFLASP